MEDVRPLASACAATIVSPGQDSRVRLPAFAHSPDRWIRPSKASDPLRIRQQRDGFAVPGAGRGHGHRGPVGSTDRRIAHLDPEIASDRHEFVGPSEFVEEGGLGGSGDICDHIEVRTFIALIARRRGVEFDRRTRDARGRDDAVEVSRAPPSWIAPSKCESRARSPTN